MLDSEVPAQQIQGMRPAGPCQMGEFSTVVRRQDQGVVTEVLDDPFEESDSGIAALLLIRINEAFPGSLLDDRALAEPPRNRTAAAGGGDIVHIHLPFNAQLRRGVVRLGMAGSLLRAFCLLPVAAADEEPAERSGMPGIPLFRTQLPVKPTD